MEKSAFQWMVEPIRKYASFSGRARRAEYWWFQLFFVLLFTGLSIIDMMLFGFDAEAGDPTANILAGIAALALLLPAVGVGIRRLHDRQVRLVAAVGPVATDRQPDPALSVCPAWHDR
jgi:uncharacterized membrane protein YhaH (DUF805 family)